MPLPSPSPDFAVVGGGIAGACLAEELALGGATVTVLDAGTEAGRATRQAAGVAVPSARYLSDPDFYAWLCGARSHLDADISRLEPESGPFSVARPILRALRAEQSADGLGDGLVEHADLSAVAPGLRLPETRRYHRSDGLMVDGGRYLDAVHDAAVALGVDWRQDVEVLDLAETEDHVTLTTSRGVVEARHVVLATGAWTSTVLAPGIGVRPQRGQMLRIDTGTDLPCILSSAFYLAPAVNGGIIVGATEEDAGFAEHTTVAALHRLLGFALAVLPDIGEARPAELRAGLRPVTPDGRPFVGRVPGRNRVFVNAGHAGHGLLSARATSVGLAAGLLHDEWDDLPRNFCPSRTLTAVAG
ncbi:glycine oxidase ThiO [Lentzea pudingi]|uniref:Glycine oxidase ThiO n=1 Tax=Lentzea pudingi TaxID=1789439 RepID=A0ABQ2HCE2_9PSEU|nr:FAD-dependent oxidoreductase [Lentzea pudingi]GGM73496.1 glycine oxidase ThiO [Lentzea pudingi]